MSKTELQGVYAAAITPIAETGRLDLAAVPRYLEFLSERGCTGALVAGTTGEGPSLSAGERLGLLEAAVRVRQPLPEFRLLAGTGTPSLQETVDLTGAAFDIGFDGVVVLPPYYFRNATPAGLFDWFAHVIETAVPDTGALLGYHIPQVSGVPLTVELIGRLTDAYPRRFAGLKDSSGSLEFGQDICQRFSDRLSIFTGNDRLLSQAISWGAAGAITALANILSPMLRAIWEATRAGSSHEAAQARLSLAREIADRYPPAAGLLKAMLHHGFGFPEWSTRLPLHMPSQAAADEALRHFRQAGLLDFTAGVSTSGEEESLAPLT